MTTQQTVKIAAKLYECRDTVKQLCPNTWREAINPWQRMISQIAKRREISLLSAAKLMVEEAQKTADGPAQLWTWAAVVELIEPSE